jgi:glycine cleavage system aminomethyltransferase T
VRANRLTFVGELGWELLVPTEFTQHVYETLIEAGRSLGLGHAGLLAVDSCRLEKGFRRMGLDVDDTTTPFEAGLGYAVAMDKPVPFVGRDALLEQSSRPLAKRLVFLALDDSGPDAPWLHGDEPVFLEGRNCGTVTSGGWGHRVGRSLGLAYLSSDALERSPTPPPAFEVEVGMRRYTASVQFEPWYDPHSTRVRN